MLARIEKNENSEIYDCGSLISWICTLIRVSSGEKQCKKILLSLFIDCVISLVGGRLP